MAPSLGGVYTLRFTKFKNCAPIYSSKYVRRSQIFLVELIVPWLLLLASRLIILSQRHLGTLFYVLLRTPSVRPSVRSKGRLPCSCIHVHAPIDWDARGSRSSQRKESRRRHVLVSKSYILVYAPPDRRRSQEPGIRTDSTMYYVSVGSLSIRCRKQAAMPLIVMVAAAAVPCRNERTEMRRARFPLRRLLLDRSACDKLVACPYS